MHRVFMLMFSTRVTRSNAHCFCIYQKPWVAVCLASAIVIGCLILGWVFAFKIQEQHVSPAALGYGILGFGYLILAIGVVLLLKLPGYFKRLSKRGGSLKLQVNHQGVKALGHNQGVNGLVFSTPLPFYPWEDIAGIELAEKVERRFKLGHPQYFHQAMLVVLRKQKNIDLFERESQGIFAAPDGQLRVVATYLPQSKDKLVEALKQFSDGHIVARYYAAAIFNYKQGVVEYVQNT